MDARFEVEEAQASFRGVAFHVKKRARDGGRRGPTHELPQRDEPDGEDLGRKVRVFKVDGLVIGDDHVAQASRLIAALEDRAGPGVYRDPWHGEWTVICRTYSAVDDDDAGGVTALTLTFEESGDTRYPMIALDTASAVERAADLMSAASVQSFARTFSVAGRPQFVGDHATDLVGRAVTELKGMGLPRLDITAAIGIPDVGAELTAFETGLPGMLRGDLGGGMAGLFRSFGAAAHSRRGGLGDPSATRTAFAGLGGFGSGFPTIPATTGSRRAQAANQAALVALVRRQAVAEESRALAGETWSSFDDAMAARAETLSRLAAVMAAAGADGDDAAFSA
ncbi:MAG: DNA circularization N-terminal domain-containing protein, partial [Rhodospirillales bacterium]|nr:DNA circularization N-terminal domain-containing protein [Rhodospirillales bacterium]